MNSTKITIIFLELEKITKDEKKLSCFILHYYIFLLFIYIFILLAYLPKRRPAKSMKLYENRSQELQTFSTTSKSLNNMIISI